MAFRLARLRRGSKIANPDGTVHEDHARIYQTLVEKIEAQEAAQDATLAAIKLTQSFTNPVGVITATAAGVVTIATHDRVYGDGTSVSVTGGALTGLLNSTLYTVYYSDPNQAGGAVSFNATTSAVPQVGNIHVVGQVEIPAAAAPDNAGAGPTAPGYTAPVYEPGYDPRNDRYDLLL